MAGVCLEDRPRVAGKQGAGWFALLALNIFTTGSFRGILVCFGVWGNFGRVLVDLGVKNAGVGLFWGYILVIAGVHCLYILVLWLFLGDLRHFLSSLV